jgi:hypothetical protein
MFFSRYPSPNSSLEFGISTNSSLHPGTNANFIPHSSTDSKIMSCPRFSANDRIKFILYTNTNSSINSIPYAHINTNSHPIAKTYSSPCGASTPALPQAPYSVPTLGPTPSPTPAPTPYLHTFHFSSVHLCEVGNFF